MSSSGAIFSRTPVKQVQVKSSPAPSRQNSAKTNVPTIQNNEATTPKKCKIQSQVQSSPCAKNTSSVNIKSKVLISCPMSPRQRRPVQPVLREDKFNEENTDIKKTVTGDRSCYTAKERVKNVRSATSKIHTGQMEVEFINEGAPAPQVNVKTIRSCFEHKNNKFPYRPPPSPSPSRVRKRLVDSRPVTPSLKGILTCKPNTESTPTFRVPASTAITPNSMKLRRSASVGTLTKIDNSPVKKKLAWSSTQNLTPKQVKFLDEVTPECFSPVLLESRLDHGSADSISGEHTNLTVAVRVRPLTAGEKTEVTVENNSVKVKVAGMEHCFTYDYCFNSCGPQATQAEVFDTLVQPMLDTAFQGYNVCLFAYGQTGSGKSYSMMGEDSGTSEIEMTTGIIPRFAKKLFNIIESKEEYSDTRVQISYFEIYNEKIHDLLGPSQSGRSVPLRVREHPELGPYVVDLTFHSVHSFETLQDWLCIGNNHKATAATDMNMNSSRSHSIFTVTMTQVQSDDRPSLCSKINLIDLAGSERIALTGATKDRLKEGVSINRSLLTLGKVISSLAEKKKRGFIPYRESILTWLLKESLGGNSRTAMLATINPSSQFVEETLSTLRYACQARNIINTVRINENAQEKRIRELVEEINRIKSDTYQVNHEECYKQLKSLDQQLFNAHENMTTAKKANKEYETEIERLKIELTKFKEFDQHEHCYRQIEDLRVSLASMENSLKARYRTVNTLEKEISEAKEKTSKYLAQIKEMEDHIFHLTETNDTLKDNIAKLEITGSEYKKIIREFHSENDSLSKHLVECNAKIGNYEKNLSDTREQILDSKIISNHDDCNNRICLLETALNESTKLALHHEEKIKNLEKKCLDSTNMSNHNGCEKEISTLKCTINELKQSNDHTNCDKTIAKLKVALNEAEIFITELEREIGYVKDINHALLADKEQSQREVITLKNTLLNSNNNTDVTEYKEKIASLKKALTVAMSKDNHIHCENRIIGLEKELRDMMSVTLMDHTQCEEKINIMFSAAEKYADENKIMIDKHQKEITEYTKKIEQLQTEISTLKETICKSEIENSVNKSIKYESHLKSIKEENAKLKKKKLEDDKKLFSLDQQVMSLTKELLEVKNQHRSCVRDKESSESLCAKLQEQLTQQDRKLALNKECSKQLFDDKENWETPSKVIRRSIAKHGNSATENRRCSLVMRADEIHEALEDAKEICSRLQIPWVFHLEPEVTTHSWFDVNLRVWDQRTMSSVRWPRDVFLGWLREMKEEIMSKSRGQKIFQSSPWIQRKKEMQNSPKKDLSTGVKELVCEPVLKEPGIEEQPLRDVVKALSKQITELESLCKPKDKTEVLSTVSVLGKAVSQLSINLGLSPPLKSIETNINIKVNTN